MTIYRFNDITNLNKIWFVSWTVLYKSENIQWQIIFLKEWLFGSLLLSYHTFPPLIPNPKPFSCVRINFTFHFKIGSVLIVRIELCFINSISWSWFVFFKVFLFSTKISSLIRKSTLKYITVEIKLDYQFPISIALWLRVVQGPNSCSGNLLFFDQRL